MDFYRAATGADEAFFSVVPLVARVVVFGAGLKVANFYYFLL